MDYLSTCVKTFGFFSPTGVGLSFPVVYLVDPCCYRVSQIDAVTLIDIDLQGMCRQLSRGYPCGTSGLILFESVCCLYNLILQNRFRLYLCNKMSK